MRVGDNMLIAVVNTSSLCTNTDVETMCQAIQIQLDLHIAPAWNAKPATIKFYSDPKTVPGYAWLINVMDNPDVAGALGYHSEDNDKVDAFIFCKPVFDNGGSALWSNAGFTVSSVLSHEVAEAFGDRFANAYVDGPTIPQGSTYALELADAVESDSYEIDVNGIKVLVSNFLFPSWFNPQATSALNMPFDYMKKLSAPFTMSPGGYMIVRAGGPGSETQVFGEHIPEWRKNLKRQSFSRFGRRTNKNK